jgi:hypothetical protein
MRDRIAATDVIAPDLTMLWVSTVRLPFPVDWPIPTQYETMVFKSNCGAVTSWQDLHCERYETLEEAQRGHAHIVVRAQAGEFTTPTEATNDD